MDRNEVILRLREHEADLRAAGVVKLAVFGSVARGDNSPGSGVDLLAEFDKSRQHTLLTMGRLELQLADWLGAKVDLASPDWLKDPIRERVLKEAVVAFS
jgi:predicted nucleotidyltransferase